MSCQNAVLVSSDRQAAPRSSQEHSSTNVQFFACMMHVEPIQRATSCMLEAQKVRCRLLREGYSHKESSRVQVVVNWSEMTTDGHSISTVLLFVEEWACVVRAQFVHGVVCLSLKCLVFDIYVCKACVWTVSEFLSVTRRSE